MPCIYAHDSFGKKVACRLPGKIKRIIQKYPEEFQIGLQGPDFLFFYRPYRKLPVNQIGYWQHKHTMADFLSAQVPYLQKNREKKLATYSYLMGFICHFALDSECHSFVISTCEKPGYNHLVIENEFDRYLLQRDGHQPVTYPIWKTVVTSASAVNAIYDAYRPLSLEKKQIEKALKGMRFYKHLLTSGCSAKRALIRGLMKLTMHYDELEGHMMNLHPKKYADKTNQGLHVLYDNAITLAMELILNFYASVYENKELSPRFSTTFYSNAPIQ